MHFIRQCSMAVVLLVLPMMRSDEDTNSSGAAAYPAIIVRTVAEGTSLMPTHQQ